jgi:hypothetical protein
MHTYDIALDLNDSLHLIFFPSIIDNKLDKVKYACRTDNEWKSEEIDIGELSLVSIDLLGTQSHVAYVGSPYEDLMYAYKSATGWNVMVVDNTGSRYYWNPSIELDSLGHPHISYNDHNIGALKYARRIDNGWEIQTLDIERESGEYSSLALDSKDNPHILYDTTDAFQIWGDLKYCYWTGDKWVRELVAEESCPEKLVLDENDRPHILFKTWDEGLKYARLLPNYDPALRNPVPTAAEIGGPVTFRITYSDPDNDPPEFVSVWVDNTAHEMNLVADDPEGATYEAILTLEPGQHEYYFEARDWGVTVRLPAEGAYRVSVAPAGLPLSLLLAGLAGGAFVAVLLKLWLFRTHSEGL